MRFYMNFEILNCFWMTWLIGPLSAAKFGYLHVFSAEVANLI